jgi:LAS superfamily LD-carboxypeptidase LdcB
MNFSDREKEILYKFLTMIKISGLSRLSSMEDLWKVTDNKTKLLIKKILQIDPAKFGFNGEKISENPIPNDMVKIDDSQYIPEGENSLDPYSYLPKPVFESFNKMNCAFIKAFPDRKLVVGSGYRSPAYQIATLIYILVNNYNFDISQTLKRVAMPQYSQHCSVSETAIDIMNVGGEPTDEHPEEFKNSVEYDWLTKNAKQFGFYESYPPNNPYGIVWEPWHWQYRIS